MKGRGLFCGLLFILIGYQPVSSQRSYAAHSVLASGTWYQLAITRPGIYRIDLSFLRQLGLNNGSVPAASIRLVGNNAGMLSEDNRVPRPDDLQERAIEVLDGGDGSFDGADYLLFYSEGPHAWFSDSSGVGRHQTDLYSDTLYYFLSVGGNGLRIASQSAGNLQPTRVTQYDYRYFYEKDSFNFLASGKEWYGEEFTDAPGKTLSRSFPLPIDLQSGEPVRLRYSFASRAVGNSSAIQPFLNGQPGSSLLLPPVSGGLYDLFAQERETQDQFTSAKGPIQLEFRYAPGSFNAQGWLNWFEVQGRRPLRLGPASALSFRDNRSLHSGAVSFAIAGTSAASRVWDVSDPAQPVSLGLQPLSDSIYFFTRNTDSLREYLAFLPDQLPVPIPLGPIPNQDLHGGAAAEMILVAPPEWRSAAEAFADFHRDQDGLSVIVADTRQIFREFASGRQDPVAIRDFVKMNYDRALQAGSQPPRYLLLLGDGSYDYKNHVQRQVNGVPVFESRSTLDPLATYTSDDFFGFLDDQESIEDLSVTNLLDLAIGRIPAKTMQELNAFRQKMKDYHAAASLGPWRLELELTADDEDNNLHLQDAEVLAATIQQTDSLEHLRKVYLDAFRQESAPGGSRYPEVNQLINNQISSGMLLWNYSGHGGPERLAEEAILDQQSVNSWTNRYRLPLFITATCDFAPYDNPAVASLGENILLRPQTGGIALLTTTRVVYAFSNRLINNNYLRYALQNDSSGQYRSIGRALQLAKNYTSQTSGDLINNRKFTLLGDPALKLAFPKERLLISQINGVPLGAVPDTLRATDKVTFEGLVTDINGQPLTDFNGSLYPVLYDKPQTRQTLANDPGSQPVGFSSQDNILFRGKASVSNGRFSFSFRIPKDINYQPGNGRLSLYAENGITDAGGRFTDFLVGGTGTGFLDDQDGPVIKAWLNDEKFINGGLSNETPVLLLELSDSSGINTAGTGIDHDLVATLDNDNQHYFVLNDFYEAALDNYQAGKVRFQLPELEAGPHSLTIKAWDVLNNSSDRKLDFIVAKKEDLRLSHVLNYPNPFTTQTAFWFEHNKPGQDLLVQVQIFTITGKLIKIIRQTINTSGNRSTEVIWDGRDRYGDKLARGVYLYRLKVSSSDQQSREIIQKMVIF